MQTDEVRVLLDASSLQISGAIAAAVQASLRREGAGISDILYPDLLALGIFFLIFFAAAMLMLKREVA